MGLLAIDIGERLHFGKYSFWITILLSIGFAIVIVILVIYGYLVFKKWQIALLESGEKQRKLINLIMKLLEKARSDEKVTKNWIQTEIEAEWKKIERITQ